MNEEFTKPVTDLFKEIEDVTGKPVKVEKTKELLSYAGVNVAGSLDSSHLFRYRDEKNQYLQFLAAHECLHVLRVCDAAPEERVELDASEDELDNAYRDLFGVKNRFLVENPTGAQHIFRFLLGDLQSSVLDLWVDEEVKRRFKGTEIEAQQREYFSEMRAKLQGGISPRNQAGLPPLAFHNINATKYAFYRLIACQFVDADDIIENEYSKHPEIVRHGDQLIDLTRRNKLVTFADDRRLVDKWAISLGMLNWYHWKLL